MQIYVKPSINCDGMPLQTFDLLSPTWSGESLRLPFGEGDGVRRLKARDDNSRKPRPGMLLALMGELGYLPSETIMVGDQASDQQAAQAAECGFVWANIFFGGEQ